MGDLASGQTFETLLQAHRLALPKPTHDRAHLNLHQHAARELRLLLQDDEDLAEQRSEHMTKRGHDGCQDLLDFPLRPTAQFGLVSGNYTLEAAGSFACYSDEEYTSGALHTVILGDDMPLLPSVQYFYRAGDPKYGWSSERSFVSAPQVGAGSLPYRQEYTGKDTYTARRIRSRWPL